MEHCHANYDLGIFFSRVKNKRWGVKKKKKKISKSKTKQRMVSRDHCMSPACVLREPRVGHHNELM
jgi:hypothetical protein